jgi:hypothetical protein
VYVLKTFYRERYIHDNIITTHLQDRDNRRLKDGIIIITSGGMVREITFTAHESQCMPVLFSIKCDTTFHRVTVS